MYLSWTQRAILRIIRETVDRRGYPPTWRELGEAVGLTRQGVAEELDFLFLEGYIEFTGSV